MVEISNHPLPNVSTKKKVFSKSKIHFVLWLGHWIRTFRWYKVQVLKSLKVLNSHFTTHVYTITNIDTINLISNFIYQFFIEMWYHGLKLKIALNLFCFIRKFLLKLNFNQLYSGKLHFQRNSVKVLWNMRVLYCLCYRLARWVILNLTSL